MKGSDLMAGYTLNLGESRSAVEYTRTYREKELEEMTTIQLRDICTKEKIIKGITNVLNRYELIETILRYRGEKETLFIFEKAEGGYERLEEILRKKLGSVLKDEGTIRNPAKIIVYTNLEMSPHDRYKVEIDHQKRDGVSKAIVNHLGESNVLLVSEENELCGVFNLVSDGQDEPEYYLAKSADIPVTMAQHRHYFLLFFEKKESDYLYSAYYDMERSPAAVLNYYKVPLVDIEIREAEETDAILSIDFGTSNTTAGAYLDYGYVSRLNEHDILNGCIKTDDINLVEFLDYTKTKKRWMPLLPTVVSVTDCSNPEKIKYKFGYDALKETKIKYYDETFSVFYEIKRWVNSYDTMQEIVDKKGNVAYVPRYTIIKQYFDYVIKNAEQRFKCKFRTLHLTSPVKLKQQYHKMFKEILSDYVIETDHMLDEGTAVVYNTIAGLIDKKRYYDGERMQALIIDCGGGTTDLSSCSFVIRNESMAYDVDIETTYENGDTNFGGNNITYRIMQFIKIIFARYYTSHESIKLEELIQVPAADIFRFVDEYGKDKVYENLEKAYEEAEKIIPTKFKNYENHTRDEYFMVKNNFYFLFDIADKLKKQFYMNESVIRNRFQSNYEEENEDLKITRIDRWNLVVKEKGRLTYNHNFPDVIFNIKEVELLLKADIYEIVNKFLLQFFKDGTLGSYSIIKLTGQSCRIDIFREALKEFIPGKCIEFKQHSNDNASIMELKLACVKGAIQYVNSRKIGFTDVNLHYCMPMIPYSVTGFTHENEEVQLICCLEKVVTAGYLSRNRDIRQLELLLKDGYGKIKFRYNYRNNPDEYKKTTFEDVKELYGRYIYQDDTDNITDREVKFFVFAAGDQWGFFVVPITRDGTQLYIGREEFFAFENDMWEVDFFDGTK